MSKRRKYFDDLPGVKRPRANFDLSHRVPTTMRPGLLHPVDIVEVLPGDTWTVDGASLIKSVVPLIRPIMDDVFIDTYSFFVPLRICFDGLEDVFGDSSPSAYSEPDLSVIPSFRVEYTVDSGTVSGTNIPKSGTVCDYLGMTPDLAGVPSSGFRASADYSVLPIRAFALIWNEYFRNQQIDQEVAVNLGSVATGAEMPNTNEWAPANYAGQLPPVRRYGDYFSTAMLAPQKGPAVKIPGITGTRLDTAGSLKGCTYPIKFGASGGLSPSAGELVISSTGIVNVSPNSNISGSALASTNFVVGNSDDGTINALRTAFQLQKYLERDAFYGSRYREYLYASYGVISQDARLQVPEFLGGTHNRLNISQIMSTAATDQIAQGQFSGQISSLSQKNLRFSKSIPEHGYIMTVACIRYKHLYSQAVQKLWFRKRREDFYDPLFSNLGQMAIHQRELIGGDLVGNYSNILGYQENFAEYRTILDRVTGQMRPTDGNTGQYWSLADRFDASPGLSDLVHEQTDSFDRVLASLPAGVHPFVVDFNFRCSVARVVSPYSMPGFADHH